MYSYGQKAVERVWNELRSAIRAQTFMLSKSVTADIFTEDELQVDVQRLFFLSFYKYYENERQFKRFIFTCTKNMIRNKLKKNQTKRKHFATHPDEIMAEIGLARDEVKDSYARVWNNVPDKKNSSVDWGIVVQEIVERLDENCRQIFWELHNGATRREIAKENGITLNALEFFIDRIAGVTKEVVYG